MKDVRPTGLRPLRKWTAPSISPIVNSGLLGTDSDGKRMLDDRPFTGTAILRAPGAPIGALSFADGIPDGNPPFRMLNSDLPEPLIVMDEADITNHGGPGMFDPDWETLIGSEPFTGIVLQTFAERVGYLSLVKEYWTVEHLGIDGDRLDWYIHENGSDRTDYRWRSGDVSRFTAKRGSLRTKVALEDDSKTLLTLAVEGETLDDSMQASNPSPGIDQLRSHRQFEGIRLGTRFGLAGDGIDRTTIDALARDSVDSVVEEICLTDCARLDQSDVVTLATKLNAKRVDVSWIACALPIEERQTQLRSLRAALPGCSVTLSNR